jgi:hypothetical protein
MWLLFVFGLPGYGLTLLLMKRGIAILAPLVALALFVPLSVAWVRWVPLIKR